MTIHAGIYALRHRPTGKLYVGSSKDLANRRGKWWRELNTRSPTLPFRITELAGDRRDWDFIVLWSGEATPARLLEREQQALQRVQNVAPERCLNSVSATRSDVVLITAMGEARSLRAWAARTGVPKSTISYRLRIGWTPEQAVGVAPPPNRDRTEEHAMSAATVSKVLVMDENGVVLSRREAAVVLECSKHTLVERLRRYQLPEGQARVQLADLMSRSQKYRRKG